MNNRLNLPHDLIRARGLHLVRTIGDVNGVLSQLIALLLLRGPLFIIAGSHWLPGLEIARTIHRNTSDVKRLLNGLYTARTSTCHELFDCLASRRSIGEAILVLDFLDPFGDPEIPLSIRLFRLSQCCRELQRLAFYRPVTVITTETHLENREGFIPGLTSVADITFSLESEYEPVQQPALF